MFRNHLAPMNDMCRFVGLIMGKRKKFNFSEKLNF